MCKMSSGTETSAPTGDDSSATAGTAAAVDGDEDGDGPHSFAPNLNLHKDSDDSLDEGSFPLAKDIGGKFKKITFNIDKQPSGTLTNAQVSGINNSPRPAPVVTIQQSSAPPDDHQINDDFAEEEDDEDGKPKPDSETVCDTTQFQQEGMEFNEESSQWTFRDPASGQVVKWSEAKGAWLTLEDEVVVDSAWAGSWGTNGTTGDLETLGSEIQAPENKNMTWVEGQWLFTDPATGKVMKFDNDKLGWVPFSSGADGSNPNVSSSGSESELESEHDDEGDDLAYQLRQEKAERRRAKRQALMGGVRIDEDGTEFEWDAGKRAWVPKLSEDFMAEYQAHYGCFEEDKQKMEADSAGFETPVQQKDQNTTGFDAPKTVGNSSGTSVSGDTANPGPSNRPELPPLPDDPREAKKEKRRRAREAEKNRTWFAIEDDRNTNVYVSNLPLDITTEEFEQLMAKYGIIDKDPLSKALKLKLYMDPEGKPKGDGRCCFIKVESVALCLQLLDGYELRGRTISVQRAQFEQKGEFDPKRRKRLTGKQKSDAKAKKEKLFDWRPDKIRGERPKSDCVIVLKNLFTSDEILANPALLFDLQELLQKQCEKLGEIRKIMIYENNSEGVATIGFADPAMADDCLTMMNFRILRERRISAERWDGKTKYKIVETDEEREKRIDQWNKYLEQSGSGEGGVGDGNGQNAIVK